MCRLLLGIMLISIGCSKVEPVMLKAGVLTLTRSALYSEKLALATCENRSGRSYGPSLEFGLGIQRS